MKELDEMKKAVDVFMSACDKIANQPEPAHNTEPALTPEQLEVMDADEVEYMDRYDGDGIWHDVTNDHHIFKWDFFNYRVKEPKRWKPKENQQYFIITDECEIEFSHWGDRPCDIVRFNSGNCYQTQTKAQASDDWKIKNGEWEYYFAGVTDIDSCDIDFDTLQVNDSGWISLACLPVSSDMVLKYNHRWKRAKWEDSK